MEDVEHEEAVGLFQSITGSDAATAKHVLEAHAWDLDRGIGYFMEHGTSMAGNAHDDDVSRATQRNGSPPPPTRHTSSRVTRSHPVVLDDDDDNDEDYTPPNSNVRHVDYSVLQDELARRGNSRATQGVERSRNNSGTDTDNDDDVAIVENPESPSTGSGSRGRRGDEFHDLNEDAEFAANGHASRTRDGFPVRSTDAIWPTDEPHPALAAFGGLPTHPSLAINGAALHARDSDGLDSAMLPAGINLEEARMLEAAMMGVPYQGRMPDFANDLQQSQDPAVIQQRLLREEQDQAYQDSLLADIEKKSAAEAVEKAKRDAEEQAEEEKLAVEMAQRDYERDLEDKLLSLPEEPAAGTDGSLTVLIRTPKGVRFGRRFLTTNRISDLFNFADVNAAPDFKPGEYRLVTQFPRRVLSRDLDTSLSEAGLSQKQEALFLETL